MKFMLEKQAALGEGGFSLSVHAASSLAREKPTG